MADGQECGQAASDQFQSGMSDHASAGSDWQAQASAGQEEFSKGSAKAQECFGKGAADFQKGFSGRRRKRSAVSIPSHNGDLFAQLALRNKRSVV